MKLPVPIVRNDQIFTDVEVQAPTTGTLASAHRISGTGDDFSAMATLLSGVVTRFYNEETEEEVLAKENQQLASAICQAMSYRSAEVVVLEALKLVHEDHMVEGVYPCPRCDTPVISELTVPPDGEMDDAIDTRDSINDLPIICMDNPDKAVFTLSFTESVKIVNKSNGQILHEINSITMRHPTMRDCIAAFQMVGSRDGMRLQFATYVEALTHINEQPVDKRWKNQFGMLMFDNIKNIKDMKELSAEIAQWGLDNRVSKCCKNCGKEWKAVLPVKRFFSSALQATQ